MSGYSVRFFLCLLLVFTLVACGGGSGSKTPPDGDQDGRPDAQDAFPNDPKEWLDSDKDGVGDNGDALPNDASETLDTDKDGVGNNKDAFPNDATESNDADKDGVGDNGDAFPNDASETLDTDKDGVGNNKDAFPNDATESNDADKDGTGDNADTTPLGQFIPAWPTFQGNAHHSGAVDITLNSANFKSRWYQALDISNLQQGAAGDGRVFYQQQWRAVCHLMLAPAQCCGANRCAPGVFNFHLTNPPAYAEGVVYVQTGGYDEAFLYAFNAIDGSQLFRTKLADQWSSFYAPTIVDGTVYTGGGYNGGIYAIDAKTGAQKWWQTLNGSDQFTPFSKRRLCHCL